MGEGEEFRTKRVGKKLGLSRGEVVGGSRRRKVVRARNIISYVAVHEYGLSLKEVSEALRVSKQSVLRGLAAGEVSLKKQIEKIEEFNS
jgi:chromosomal replication initiation ATPase DnaA